ncbi:VWA domain-containing protein [Candidatus Woesearchaeota archaeon]|nr:VWA domain-containing protein [Candidatus Woesearchaeota archaeon]
MKKLFALFALMLLLVSSMGVVSADTEKETACGHNNDGCIEPMPPFSGPFIDVVFLIDSTGSMSDEIREVKMHIENIVSEVQQGSPTPNVRVGIVTYRDYPNQEREYVFLKSRLTSNLESSMNFLRTINAQGGGDYKEAVATGMHEAINMNWYDNSKKIVFLIGDAGPQGMFDGQYDYTRGEKYDYRDEIERAIKRDIVFYTISGSGMNSDDVRIWKSIAAQTGGEYEKLSYVRRNVDQYYAEESISDEWKDEAVASADYDKKSNSILTNTLGMFAKKSMMAEAMNAGVVYETNPDEDKPEVIHYENIITDETEKEETSSGLVDFFRKVFEKLAFWS